jgi:hypothetical protein
MIGQPWFIGLLPIFTLLDDDDCDKPILKNLAAWLVNEFIQFRYMLECGVPLYDILWKKLS